jgi:tetratricopeptide (TPR) repeat protein
LYLPKRKLKKIKSQLEAHKLDAALENIQELIDDYPDVTYYPQLKLSVLQQIVDKINAAKGEFDNEESEIPQHLMVNEDEEDSLAEVAVKNQQLALMGNEKNNSEADSIKAMLSKKNLSRKERRKWRKLSNMMDEQPGFAEAIVTIDKNLIEESEDANTNSQSKNGATTLEAPTSFKGSNVQQEESPEGFTPIKSKDQKRAEKMQEELDYFASLNPQLYEQQMIDIARRYTLDRKHIPLAGKVLYESLIDTVYGKIKFKAQALELISLAQEDLQQGEATTALVSLNKAMEIEPTLYEAYLLMADAYLILKEDSMALLYWHTATEVQPDLVYADEQLSKYYLNKGEFQHSLDYLMKCILRYPKTEYFLALENLAIKSGNEYNSQWIKRDVFPISNTKRFEEIMVDTSNAWAWYQAAKYSIGSYADKQGIMRPNELTRETYLEVAAWLNMLDSNKGRNTQFKFAREMARIGYLDCYTLITLFHHDLYPQFKHLVTHNPAKVRNYFLLLTQYHRKRFDDVREAKPKVQGGKGKK